MSEPVTASMAEVREHLTDVIDRARRDETPTIITREGKSEAILVGIDEYRRLHEAAERYEDEWLNRLADKAESEGTHGSVSLEEMDALLRSANRPRHLLTRLTTHAQRDLLEMPLPEAGRVLCRLADVQEAMRTGDRIYDVKPLRGHPAR